MANPISEKDSSYDLTSLRDFFDGNENAVVDILRLIVEEIPVFLQKIKTEAEASSWEEVYRSAHKFKPVTISLGLPGVRQVITRIEDMAISKKFTEQIPSLIKQIDSELVCIREQLKKDFNL